MKLIRLYFLLGAIPALIAVGLAAALDYQITRRLVKEQIDQTLDVRLQAASERVRDFLDRHLARLQTLAVAPTVKNGSVPEIMDFLNAQQLAAQNEIEGLYYNELNGTVHTTQGTNFQVADRDYFSDLVQGHVVVTRILKSRDSGKDILLMLVPVLDADGTQRGALGMTILDQQLVQFVQSLEVGQTGLYALADDTDHLISTTSDAENLFARQPLQPSKPLHDAAGASYRVSSVPVSGTNWRLVGAYPQAEVQAVYDRIMWSKATAVASGLAAAVLLALFFGELTSRPLQRLIAAFRGYSGGDLTVRVPRLAGNEFGVLADSFNQLADQLEDARQKQRTQMESLEASEDRFRHLFDGAADAICLRDSEGTIIDANQAMCQALGYTHDELIGMSVSQIDQDWTVADAQRIWNQMAVTGRTMPPKMIERVHRRKDGTTFPVEIRLTTIQSQGEQFIMSACRDATLRKSAEGDMKAAKEFAEKVINASPGVIFIVDVPTRSIVFINDNVEKELGYTPQQIKHLGPSLVPRLVHPDEYDDLYTSLKSWATVGDGEIVSQKYRLRHAAGGWKWFQLYGVVFQRDAQGAISQLMGVGIDISERIQAEQELHWEKALLEQVMETTVAATIVVDAEGQFLFVNSAAEKTLQVRRDQLQGHVNSEFDWKVFDLQGNPLPLEQRPFLTIKRTLKPFYDHQFMAELASGMRALLSINGAPLFDSQHQFSGAVFVVTDVTQRIANEKEREALIRDLEATNAELKQFTYTVSHDLKSPLITIKGFLGILSEDLAAGDRAAIDEDISIISSAANGMKQLLDDLLQLSRIGRNFKSRSLVPLREAIDEAKTLLAGELETRGANVHSDAGDLRVYGDPVQIRQLLQNLIDNAIKHNDGPQPEVTISGSSEGECVLIEVADNGPGIKPEYQERVFQLFDKLDPDSDGTGIGLAIVRRIVDVHNGTIRIESDGEGNGCRFLIRLPAMPISSGHLAEMFDSQQTSA